MVQSEHVISPWRLNLLPETLDVDQVSPGKGSDYNLCSASASGGGIGDIDWCRSIGRDDTLTSDAGSL